MSSKNILKSLKMDSETTFYENGNITSHANSWEQSKAPMTESGKTVAMRGRMTVQADGATSFVAYNVGTPSRFKTLFRVLNGSLKETNKNIVVNFCMSKKLTAAQKVQALSDQTAQIVEYIITEQR